MSPAVLAGLVACGAWAYLLLARGFFWLARERDDGEVTEPSPPGPPSPPWSRPATVSTCNERALESLLAQDHPGPLSVILVDDASTDATAAIARRLAASAPAARPLEVLTGAPLPPRWTGKLWAVRQGIAHASSRASPPEYLLLTDADIAHAPDNVRILVQRAGRRTTWTSLMARLTVATWAERLLIPAFVFFFAMLYPFAWVNDPDRRTAAAAGGCMLVRRDALKAAGGLEAIAGESIDDCALAARLKRQGPCGLACQTGR